MVSGTVRRPTGLIQEVSMRKATLDNRKVICPNASLLCGRGRVLKRGDMFVYDMAGEPGLRLARSLGRIKTVDKDGIDCTGFICAMVLSIDGTYLYERWIDPKEVTQIFDAPTKTAAFFFAPSLPFASETIRDLMAYGTMSEIYIDFASDRAEQLAAERRVIRQ